MRLDALDACGAEGCVGLGYGVGQVDGAGGVLDDEALEAKRGAVDGGEADTEVVGEAAEEEPLKATLAEVSGETGRGEVVVFEEGGVGVDVAAKAFAQDEFGVWDVEAGMEGCAGGILQAVFGPESLRTVGGLDRLEGLPVVRGDEGDVLGGMPVLGEDDVVECLREGVDDGNNLIAFGYCEVPTRAEVVLDVDDEQSVGGLEGDRHGSQFISMLPESTAQIDDEKYYYCNRESDGNECKPPFSGGLNTRIVTSFKMLRIVLDIYGVIPMKIIICGRSVIPEVPCIRFVIHLVGVNDVIVPEIISRRIYPFDGINEAFGWKPAFFVACLLHGVAKFLSLTDKYGFCFV